MNLRDCSVASARDKRMGTSSEQKDNIFANQCTRDRVAGVSKVFFPNQLLWSGVTSYPKAFFPNQEGTLCDSNGCFAWRRRR